MKKNQRIVVDWFLNTETEFLWAIVELEGSYESIPDEVADAFEKLTDKEKVEVIQKSASRILKRMT